MGQGSGDPGVDLAWGAGGDPLLSPLICVHVAVGQGYRLRVGDHAAFAGAVVEGADGLSGFVEVLVDADAVARERVAAALAWICAVGMVVVLAWWWRRG
jgi:hypothetical protein